jgi:taurine dioxygenase
VVPPVGGDTLFCDCAAAYDALPEADKAELAGLQAIHTAAVGYGPKSEFAREADVRSMKIITGPQAEALQTHPLVRTHPVSGRKALFISPVYTWGIEGMSQPEGRAYLERLFKHMLQPQFIYRHRWKAGMLLMWDNRTTMHNALDGYEGHLRVMHRTTVAGERPV